MTALRLINWLRPDIPELDGWPWYLMLTTWVLAVVGVALALFSPIATTIAFGLAVVSGLTGGFVYVRRVVYSDATD